MQLVQGEVMHVGMCLGHQLDSLRRLCIPNADAHADVLDSSNTRRHSNVLVVHISEDPLELSLQLSSSHGHFTKITALT